MEKPFNKVTLTGPDSATSVTVSPDVIDSPSAPVPAYAMDPSTGFSKSVIQTGECPENSLGDTRTKPISMNSEEVAPQAAYGAGKGGAEG